MFLVFFINLFFGILFVGVICFMFFFLLVISKFWLFLFSSMWFFLFDFFMFLKILFLIGDFGDEGLMMGSGCCMVLEVLLFWLMEVFLFVLIMMEWIKNFVLDV